MELLKVDHLNYTYDQERYVLKDISMQFEKGKIYGIFGKSGAGKSTLLSLLAGLEKPFPNQIYYKEKDLYQWNRDLYRRDEIGIIFQSYNLLPQFTAVENVVLSMDISHVDGNRKQKAYAFLEQVGIGKDKADRRVLHLSGGEQQRVAIARAISYDSQIILADEPTGNLDKETEEEIVSLLTQLAHTQNKCVIIVSHASKVRESVDICYELKNGKIITL